ncbi:glycoside hydrolase family 57 protein [uncultured Butyricimonas sp.]|uniref:glycoside hydrolase family 57 protein n=1 Tax=uncultured Butyricimonas sp. TaxID=1268785 RepID=UPI002592188B|nr:glycoside hydrolase family 57 protein [uncultured Butyricimonas sp.]
MKKTLCFYFQIHQPVRLRRYRFFDIGKRHDYFDEYVNRSTIRRITEKCYLPMNHLIMDLIKRYGTNFKVSFSISGSALEQFALHAPEVIESFKELAKTGSVEFLAETYAHSLASLSDTDEFERQVQRHTARMEELFGQKPVTLRNSSLIYSDQIGERVAAMGFESMLTDGAKHVLGWKSPNFVYTNVMNPRLKLLLKNSRLSDDLTLRFSDHSWHEWPLTADKYARWLKDSMQDSEIVNLFMNYETFGENQLAETGIFEFMRSLPEYIFSTTDFEFLTPSEAVKKHQPVAPLHVPYPISWADEEKDITGWLGNELQNEAFEELFKIQPKVEALNDPELNEDYSRLQASDHFYYMRTKLFSDNDYHRYVSPYETPYEAFINYMNVLSDFVARVEDMEKIRNIVGNEITEEEKSPEKKKRTPRVKSTESAAKATKKVSTKEKQVKSKH